MQSAHNNAHSSSRPTTKTGQIYCNPPAACRLVPSLTPKRASSLGKIVTRPVTRFKSIEVQTMEVIPQMELTAHESRIKEEKEKENNGEKGDNTRNHLNKADKTVKFAIDATSRSNGNLGLLKVADYNIIGSDANLNKTIRKSALIQLQSKDKDTKQNQYNKQATVYKKLTTEPTNNRVQTTPSNTLPLQSNPSLQKFTSPLTSTLTRASVGHLTSTSASVPTSTSVTTSTLSTGVGSSAWNGQERTVRSEKIEKLSAVYQKNLARYQSSKQVLGDLLNHKLLP